MILHDKEPLKRSHIRNISKVMVNNDIFSFLKDDEKLIELKQG